jgi:hypothetical protein
MSTRKSPKESATKFLPETIKEGQDGNMWEVVVNKNGIQRWQRLPHVNMKYDFTSRTHTERIKKLKKEIAQNLKRMEKIIKSNKTGSFVPKSQVKSRTVYLIHDNGGRPFKFVAENGVLEVFAHGSEWSNELHEYPTKVLRVKNFKGYWKGLDIGGAGMDMYGSNILIQLTDHKYIIVGMEIVEFEIKDKIIDFISPVGNSDVPYPIAYGTEYTYDLTGRQPKYVANDVLAEYPSITQSHEIYNNIFYSKEMLKQGKIKKVSKFKVLTERVM